MWYVIQTMTGHEEELVRMINRVLPQNVYEECFVAYFERIWRKQQQSLIHVERLFPGYVFVVSDDPNELYQCLKKVPAMSRLMSDGLFHFLPLEEGEEEFFKDMLDGDHIVRLSYVEKDSRGHVYRLTGPAKKYMEQVVRWQYKKRYVLIRLKLLGKEKIVSLGIILNEDVRQEIAYGKVEAPLTVPDVYRIEIPGADKPDMSQLYEVGDSVVVVSGALAGMVGVVWKVKKNTVEIGIRLFGQDMAMEVPVRDICREEVRASG